MQENKVVQTLIKHMAAVPYSLDREYFSIAIKEIERLQRIVDSTTFPHNDHMLKRIDDA